MEIHFTPEQEAQLSQIASQAGTDPERLVKDAALRFPSGGCGLSDRDEFIEENEMDVRLAQMLRS
jgi:hypothetical protein